MKKLFIEFINGSKSNAYYEESKEIKIHNQGEFIEFNLYKDVELEPSSIIVIKKNDLIHYSITNV